MMKEGSATSAAQRDRASPSGARAFRRPRDSGHPIACGRSRTGAHHTARHRRPGKSLEGDIRRPCTELADAHLMSENPLGWFRAHLSVRMRCGDAARRRKASKRAD
jgi:hypothetical protein